MKYKCLVFDHDDTVVNSTATIHYPCFQKYLDSRRPGRTCSLEEYFLKNFDPGFLEMCCQDYGMDDADIQDETQFWLSYVKEHIPTAYPGIGDIMRRHKQAGGILCVVSHSFRDNIYRDFAHNNLPTPDAVFGWELPPEQRKPNAYPLEEIMRNFSLSTEEMLIIDDLKPGYDMAAACGVDFAAAGWANNIAQIESFMRANCEVYCKSVDMLDQYLQETNI